MFRSRAVPTLLCLCVSMLPATLHAQVSPIPSSRLETGLNDADLRAMNAAAAPLYQKHTVASGATDTWSNPQSGNGGSVTVLQSFTKSDMPCRKVRYDVHLRSRRGMRSYTVNWCKTATGTWKML
jgi:surface antigen